jgi:predicted dehydrogenase
MRIAIIGMGIRGQMYARTVQQNPAAVLVGVADINNDTARQAAARYQVPSFSDVEQMLDETHPDALIIATPDFAHRAPALAAAARRIHLLIEKPLATTTADATAIVEAVERAGVTCQVAFENRWNPAFVQVKSAIERGDLGRLCHMNARLNDTVYVPTRMLSWAGRSTVGWFLLSHLVDMAMWLSGQRPQRVYATATRRVLPTLGVETLDSLHTILSFPGFEVMFETSWVLPESLPTVFDLKFEIVGDRGALFVDCQDQMVHQAIGRYSYPGTLVTEIDGRLRGFPMDMVDSFITAVSQGKASPVSLADGLAVTQIVEAAHRSAEVGEPLHLSL